MKKAVVFIGALFMANTIFGQAYIITYLKGDVYYKHKLVKLHDKLDGIAAITSSDKTAELALFSAQKGKFRLSFVNSKPIAANQTAKNSELYQIIVANYIQPYTTEKTLTSRGDFDLKTCFNGNATDDGNKTLLIEGEILPAKSSNLKINPTDKFFIYTVIGKDTIANPINRNSSFLIFDRQAFNGFKNIYGTHYEPAACFLKRGYILDGKYVEETFSGPLTVVFLTKENLQDMISAFEDGLQTYYQNDKQKMIADIESQLTYYYGDYFEPAVRRVITGLIN